MFSPVVVLMRVLATIGSSMESVLFTLMDDLLPGRFRTTAQFNFSKHLMIKVLTAYVRDSFLIERIVRIGKLDNSCGILNKTH